MFFLAISDVEHHAHAVVKQIQPFGPRELFMVTVGTGYQMDLEPLDQQSIESGKV